MNKSQSIVCNDLTMGMEPASGFGLGKLVPMAGFALDPNRSFDGMDLRAFTC